MPIIEQLRLEEALLRADTGNWCLINQGAPKAIVMGISGKPEKLIDLTLAKKRTIPLIKRFSGGGTVYIDDNTLFVTFICNEPEAIMPKAIMEWSEKIYQPLFPEGFRLRENDYCLGERKFGGNAQYIQKGRWLHHTSFLWDYDPKQMDVLLLPEKRPSYREDRSHKDFLCTLCDYFPDKQAFLGSLICHLEKQYAVTHKSLAEVLPILDLPHRRATEELSP